MGQNSRCSHFFSGEPGPGRTLDVLPGPVALFSFLWSLAEGLVPGREHRIYERGRGVKARTAAVRENKSL